MVDAGPSSFGHLLKRYRAASRLSQEELAERAGLSARAISDLERGVKHRPHGYTVQRLGRALDLAPEDRAAFEAAAQSPGTLSLEGGRTLVREGRQEEATAGTQIPPDVRLVALPIQPTSFIGRESERQRLARLLGRDDVRLLTLTGPGGTGKTRLALQVAADLADAFPDGICFVSLASVADPGLVESTIADTLGLHVAGRQVLVHALQGYLRDRQLLLVLDSFEHLLEAAPLVGALLSECPRLKLLVTSRAVLHLAAERVYAVPPLSLPDRTALPDVAGLFRYDAVTLFLTRAQAARTDFTLAADDVPAVAEICSRLDGLPLAIELAAVRIRLFPPQALLGRLSSRIGVLTGGARDLPTRQQTLRGAIDWSYGLLAASEQHLFRRLAVFAGGCALEAAEAICNVEGELDMIDGVASLIDQSLLQPAESSQIPALAGDPRVAMLETIREYALEQLERSGEAEALRSLHAEYYLALAEEAEPALLGAGQAAWLPRLEDDHHNLRAALRWCIQSGDAERGLRLGGALWRFWYVHSHFTEGRQWLSDLLRLPDAAEPSLARAKALNGAGNLAYCQGEYGGARVLHEESLALRRRLDDRPGIAASLNNLALLDREEGDYATASRLLEEAIDLARESQDRSLEAIALGNLGNVRHRQALPEAARVMHAQALALFTASGDEWGQGMALCDLAAVAQDLADIAEARASYEESCARRRAVGDRRGLAVSLAGLSAVVLDQGEVERAQALLAESLCLCEAVPDTAGLLAGLEGVAVLAAALGQVVEAAQVGSAVTALGEALGPVRSPVRPARLADLREQCRQALGEAAFERAWAEGALLSLERVLSLSRRIFNADR